MSTTKKNPKSPDHIGWDLWRATQSWKQRFTRDMINSGHAWYGEARGGLIQFIGRQGIAQTDLATEAGMSKQAVQQHLDDLAADGIIERISDPEDARRKRVIYTDAGHQALDAANEIKFAIEKDYRKLLGASTIATMKRALRLISDTESTVKPISQ